MRTSKYGSQRVEHQDYPDRGGSETKGHLRNREGYVPLTEVICQRDLFESAIDESGDGKGGRRALNGWRHYSSNGYCVEKKRRNGATYGDAGN